MKMVDLSGQKFTRWTVIERAGRKVGQTLWRCVCECGTERAVSAANLRNGMSKSCGCLKDEQRHARLINLTGKTFGFLTVIGRGPNSNTGLARWACKCECGNTGVYFGSALKEGHTKSCGCATSGFLSEASTTHGHKRSNYTSPTYNTWRAVKNRCRSPRSSAYAQYGAKGITMADRWADSFEAFLEDMGERPSMDHTLDRIDVRGNYEPGNCRWADWLTQANNKTNNVYYTLNGETKTAAQWARGLGGNPSAITTRLRRGWSLERALTTKIVKSSKKSYIDGPITHNGVTKLASEWSRDLGGHNWLVGKRLSRGWSVEDAVTKKVA